MSEATYRTNNVPRPILDGYDLRPAEREQFDYLNWPGIDEGTDSASFFRYKGEVYDLGTFTRSPAGSAWDGVAADSAFTGTVVRLVMVDGEQMVVVGRVFS